MPQPFRLFRDMDMWALLHYRRMARRHARDKLRVYRRQLRDTLNPFEMREVDFSKLFRTSRALAHDLCEQLTPLLQNQRSNHLPVHSQVLTALRFFATGSYQRSVGQDFVLAVSQSSVSNCVRTISLLISEHISHQWISFPQTFEERQHERVLFLEKTGFPGVVGCIDCSHIAIARPHVNEAAYFNHNRYHSINVQVVCSYDLRILHIDPTMPGSVHDQFIFRYGELRQALQQFFDDGLRNVWLLGDSGYVLEPYLLTPILNAAEDSPEGRYTAAHSRTRNCVERLFGVWKTEWRCLLRERVLKYSPEIAAHIITACAVLNNMMRHYRIAEPADIINEEFVLPDEHDEHANDIAANVRAAVVQRHFT